MLDLVDLVVAVVPVTLVVVLVDLLPDLEPEMPVVLVEGSHLMLVAAVVVVPVELVKQDPKVHNMLDMVDLEHKHLQRLDPIHLQHMVILTDHHLVEDGLLEAVVEEEETLQQFQQEPEVDHHHQINQIILDGLVQELEVMDHQIEGAMLTVIPDPVAVVVDKIQVNLQVEVVVEMVVLVLS
tara:strand:- start:36 stop:581 length:546 start_codon:yes stop_codon:yes gene_type:complete